MTTLPQIISPVKEVPRRDLEFNNINPRRCIFSDQDVRRYTFSLPDMERYKTFSSSPRLTKGPLRYQGPGDC